MIKSSIILPRWLCKHKTNQSIVNSNLSHVYATKAVHSLVKGLANDYVTFGERNKINLAPMFEISKQQISDISKNKDEILKFVDSLEMSEGVNKNT